MKKIIVSILLVNIVMVLSGCDLISEMFKTNEINASEIFDQVESGYYVYFYKDDCQYCDMVSEVIAHLERDGVSIYKVNLSKNKNKLIGRAYDGIDAEGSNNKYKVTGVATYEELYISIAPTIILIEYNNEAQEKQAKYVAGGTKEILDIFSN